MRYSIVKGLICAAVFLTCVQDSSARPFLWPWQHHIRHHRAPSSAVGAQVPDCDEINAVARRLTPQRYKPPHK